MCKCMIYKIEDSDEKMKNYSEKMDEFAEYLVREDSKGKIPLFITGSGISRSVPNMAQIMNKIQILIEEHVQDEYSSVFQKIYKEYVEGNELEEHMQQSKLLTYIQNAYLDQDRYIQKEDKDKLKKVWEDFVLWLLNGSEKDSEKGVLKAQPSKAHKVIAEAYRQMRAISITTNFDNLLKKAFKEEENFYPILEKKTFNLYFDSRENDNSFIEIQSRGDVFWVRCTGERNRVCPNRNRQCYIPGESLEIKEDIKCKICGSKAKVYFAFPGTKEKDAEMSKVMEGVWKYFAYKISSIIIIGNSMDYDPVLCAFVQELIYRKNIPVLYISRYKKKEEGIVGIDKKAATRAFFKNYDKTKNIWARAEDTDSVLEDLVTRFVTKREGRISKEMDLQERENAKKIFKQELDNNFAIEKAEDFDKFINRLMGYKVGLDIICQDEVEEMKRYSQLGLKTYWLEGRHSQYQLHNRYKHSIGVMLATSYLYMKIQNEPSLKELKFLQMAAFFHDVGHLPFSHLLEEIFHEFGWITAGEVKTFNHEQHTQKLVKQFVAGNEKIKQNLEFTGYSVEDLLQLIAGEFGIGYLDALINSPVDCDKIEYLFSDSIFTGRGTKKDFMSFIEDFGQDIEINSNKFLVMSGRSTKRFLELLEMRGRMYEEVYLRKGLRYLEACCKLIIRTFIACKCSEREMFSKVKENKFDRFFNLSEVKIDYIIEWFEEKLKELSPEEVCEIYVLKQMVNEIDRFFCISNIMKETIHRCLDKIVNVKSEEAVREIEKECVVTYDISDQKYQKESLNDLMKNIYLRFPGTLLVDYVESKATFSFGKTGKKEKRADGTKGSIENILIADIHCTEDSRAKEFKCLGEAVEDINKELHFPHHAYINLYRITDDSYRYMQAEDYVISQLRAEGVIA